jgi:hypothetical protein
MQCAEKFLIFSKVLIDSNSSSGGLIRGVKLLTTYGGFITFGSPTFTVNLFFIFNFILFSFLFLFGFYYYYNY